MAIAASYSNENKKFGKTFVSSVSVGKIAGKNFSFRDFMTGDRYKSSDKKNDTHPGLAHISSKKLNDFVVFMCSAMRNKLLEGVAEGSVRNRRASRNAWSNRRPFILCFGSARMYSMVSTQLFSDVCGDRHSGSSCSSLQQVFLWYGQCAS